MSIIDLKRLISLTAIQQEFSDFLTWTFSFIVHIFTYHTFPAECGGSLGGTEGVVAFPGAGFSQYNHNVSCAWVIWVPRGQVINITFSYFHLEGGSCRFDWLQVRSTTVCFNSFALVKEVM